MDEFVKLSSGNFLYSYDEVNKVLYFIGTALEEGAWYGTGARTPSYYSRDIIHEHAHNFVGVDMWEDHTPGKVGSVLEVYLTERGFDIFGVITDPGTIHRIRYEDKRGLSVGMTIRKDVHNVVFAMLEFNEISVVEAPACTVCTIDPDYYYGDKVTMTAEINDKRVDAFKEVYEAAENYKAAQEKLSQAMLDSETEDKKPCPLAGKDSEEEITMTENIEEQTTVEEPVAEKPVAEEPAVEEPVAEEEVVKMSAHVAVQEELDAVKETLGAKESELESVKAELAETQETLASMVNDIKAKSIESIKLADPDADEKVLETMSIEQLSAFEASVKGAAPKIGSERTSKEAETLSAKVEEPPVFAGIIGYLQSKQG